MFANSPLCWFSESIMGGGTFAAVPEICGILARVEAVIGKLSSGVPSTGVPKNQHLERSVAGGLVICRIQGEDGWESKHAVDVPKSNFLCLITRRVGASYGLVCCVWLSSTSSLLSIVAIAVIFLLLSIACTSLRRSCP
jgi:hypothetical protein